MRDDKDNDKWDTGQTHVSNVRFWHFGKLRLRVRFGHDEETVLK